MVVVVVVVPVGGYGNDMEHTGGAPLGYFNWSMLNQAVIQGIESVVLFGGVYVAIEYAFSKRWISKL